jgi:regulatory protein
MSEQITAIDPLPSNPNLLRIRVDGAIIARLPRSDAESLELEVGQRWTASLARKVEHALALGKARKAALTILGRRAVSQGELVERLTGKGHEQAIAKAIADELVADGWVDDATYAESIVHDLTRKKPASAQFLMEKLQKHLIDHDIAQQAIDHVLETIDPNQAANELAQQRLASMKSLPRATAARRIAGLLARRGFDEHIIEHTLEQCGLIEDAP